jgi:arylsulfatase A-like enzyme
MKGILKRQSTFFNFSAFSSCCLLFITAFTFLGVAFTNRITHADCVEPTPGMLAWWTADDTPNDQRGAHKGTFNGTYQQRFGHEENPTSDNDNPRLGLPEPEITLPQILSSAGYVCGTVGKWHLGAASNLQPLQRGFDEFFGFLGAVSNYYNAKLLQGTTQIVETAYLTDLFTQEAVSFINRDATEPFFLYLAYNAPHEPYDQPPAIYMDRVRNITDPARQKYAAMITALDEFQPWKYHNEV